LQPAEHLRVRVLLRSRPSPEALAELDRIAGQERVVPGYLLAMKHWDDVRALQNVLHEMLRTRYADPWDYWRAL